MTYNYSLNKKNACRETRMSRSKAQRLIRYSQFTNALSALKLSFRFYYVYKESCEISSFPT